MKGSPHRVLTDLTSRQPRGRKLGLQRPHETLPTIRHVGVAPKSWAFPPDTCGGGSPPQHPINHPIPQDGDRVGLPDEGNGSGFAYSPGKRRVRDRGSGSVHGHGRLGAGRDATRSATEREEGVMGIGTILIIVLVLLFVGALPTWSHSSNWGYFPSGGLGLVVLIVLVLVLTGRL